MIDERIIDKLINTISKGDVNYTYFFDKLSSSKWIEPLKEKGYFSNPPGKLESRGGISYPFWAESRYLLRVVEQAPEAIINIALDNIDSNNERVHEDFTEAACKMPVKLAAKWAVAEAEWLESQEHLYMNLPYHLTDLIKYLADNKFSAPALVLAKVLFILHPAIKSEGGQQEDESGDEQKNFTFTPSPEPEAKFDRHGVYNKLLPKAAESICQASPLSCFQWLSELLEMANKLSQREVESDDYSNIWRPRIPDDPEQNHHNDIRDSIVSSLRDCSLTACKKNQDNIDQIIKLFREKPYRNRSIFKRILFYVLRAVDEGGQEYYAVEILDKENYRNYPASDEYSQLVSKRFEELKEEEKLAYFNMVLSYEEEDKLQFSTFFKRNHGKDPSSEDVENFIDKWLIEELGHIEKHLAGESKTRYEAARRRHKSYSPTKHAITVEPAKFIGSKSPISLEEISKFTDQELIKYLQDWVPEEYINTPSRDGLAKMISAAVQAGPDRFVANTRLYQSVHPSYIRGLIEGFQNTIRADLEFNWEPVLDLCAWVANQSREFPAHIVKGTSDHFREDQDWGWTRSRILDLLEDGLKENHRSIIPFNLRVQVWNIIRNLSADPDPSKEKEQEQVDPFDAAALSINTVRGRAMHACMNYIFWVRRSIQKNEGVVEEQVSFIQLPEVVELLDDHLDPEIEQTLTIHSVYGKWLPWLIAWDEVWVRENLERIFPEGENNQNLWDVAWGTYVVYNRPYNNVIQLLEDIYRASFNRMDFIEVQLSGARSVDESLAQHLMVFYGRGLISSEPQSLVHHFYLITTPELRAFAMHYVGELIQSDEISPEIIDRFKSLWLWRLELAMGSESISEFIDELSEFGRWLPSKHLDERWIMEQLTTLKEYIPALKASEETISRLSDMSKTTPGPSLEILVWLFEAKAEQWDYYLWQDPAKKMMAGLLLNCNQGIIDKVKDLINSLVAKGHLGYRELVVNRNNTDTEQEK